MQYVNKRMVKRLVNKSGFRCSDHFVTALNHKVILLISNSLQKAITGQRITLYASDLSTGKYETPLTVNIMEVLYERARAKDSEVGRKAKTGICVRETQPGKLQEAEPEKTDRGPDDKGPGTGNPHSTAGS